MDTTIEIVREKIRKLVEQFERDKHFYLSKQYLEAQARQDFIDPFFEALGWDIGNRAGLSPFEREVLLEKGETKGRPDYNFRIDGASKFYVEAKAPSEPLDKTVHIMQAKSYAWNTKDVFIVVLTDFEEFRVFDASLKPDPRNPNLGLIYDFKYTDYLEKLDELWMLSKEKVASGSLDRLLLKDAQSKRLRIPVDKSFLLDMTGWREELAKDLYKLNPDINVRMLNEVVQRILDRFVFIRIAEDRKIIEPKSLLELVELWKREGKRRPLQYHLNILFRQINADLNGEIFKPHACETYEYDSSLLAKIIEWLYFPKCPYRFDVIGVELLGSIYERYLGNTIRLTAKRVKVEEKPEVRKAGGVYYTPKYIVEYIVDNTVGKLIEGKTPAEIAEIKILDPACGSGSFLLGAYQKLIDYHIKYYTDHPAEAGRSTLFPDLIIEPDGSHRLSITKKAEILQNNIFGVDIDPQAVEVSMMSLYIKALEGERTLPQNKELLPSLANNVKCGNSLIGYDFFEQQTLIEDEERDRINPFDWDSRKAGFGDIMERGGFDVVISNPPYVRIQTMKEWAPVEVEYYKATYQSAKSGNYDIYVVFVEKGIGLLKEKGILGFILPHKFFQAKYGEGVRKFITERAAIREILTFRDNQIFGDASTYTCLLFLGRKGLECFKYTEVTTFPEPKKQLQTIRVENKYRDDSMEIGEISRSQVTLQPWNFFFEDKVGVIEKMRRVGRSLGEVTERIFQGLKTGADKIYVLKVIERGDGSVKIFSKEQGKEYELESELLKPLIKGGQMRRYLIEETKRVILFPYLDAKLISIERFESNFPGCWAYLLENRKYLENRERGKFKGNKWYEYSRNQALDIISSPKIIIPDIASSASYSYDSEGIYYFSGGAAGGYGIIPKRGIAPQYLLGILNSRLVDWYLQQISTNFRGGYYSYESRFIKQLPISTIDFSNQTEKAKHDKIVALVDRILELNKKKDALPPSSERERIEREIAVTDEKIDEMVYGLYGLTEEEIRVVEGYL